MNQTDLAGIVAAFTQAAELLESHGGTTAFAQALTHTDPDQADTWHQDLDPISYTVSALAGSAEKRARTAKRTR